MGDKTGHLQFRIFREAVQKLFGRGGQSASVDGRTHKDQVIVAYTSGIMRIDYGEQTRWEEMIVKDQVKIQGVGEKRQVNAVLPLSKQYTQIGDVLLLHRRGMVAGHYLV